MNEATIENMQPEVEAAVKPYTFRPLCGEDVFLMFKIISKIGVREFNALFEHDGIKHLVSAAMGEKVLNEGTDVSVSVTYIEVILEVADVLFRNLPKCENEIFQILSQTSDLTVAQVKKLPFAQFMEMVIDFVKKEEFADFIKVVSKLFK